MVKGVIGDIIVKFGMSGKHAGDVLEKDVRVNENCVSLQINIAVDGSGKSASPFFLGFLVGLGFFVGFVFGVLVGSWIGWAGIFVAVEVAVGVAVGE